MCYSGKPQILVTGATGYVGGRLVPMLLEKNYKVRCLVRDTSIVEGRGWKGAEIISGDVLDFSTLVPAMKDITVAYYLVHSMAGGSGFHERDMIGAKNFSRAASEAGVKRIIYLGGLGIDNDNLSSHLKSRQQTGEYLRQEGVPVTEFRAAQIIGSGSASFELIRNTVDRVPIIFASSVIRTRSQPIAIRDVLRYLIDALETPLSEGETIEIGGKQILTYREMLQTFAEIRGLKRPILELPFVTPRFCSFIVDLLTPIPAEIAKLLLEGLNNEVIVRDEKAKKIFDFEPISYEEAVRLALNRIETGQVLTTWQDAYSSYHNSYKTVKLTSSEGLIREKRRAIASSDAATTFKVISSFGGEEGWLYANYLWYLRGLCDRLFGGVGLRRGRRCPTELRIGDTLGFWRVEELKYNCLLRLRSEMKMRSRAWLQFEIEQIEQNKVLITQTAFFDPKGLLGLLYWCLLYPVHKVIFRGMIKTLAKHAEKEFNRSS